MRVLVTGGTGLIGKATVERLVRSGYNVRVIDLQPDVEIAGAEYAPCDILNYDDVLRQARGCDAIIHLAAIRSPVSDLGHRVFQVNVAGTFNVFEAAAAVGIKRVVQASSINALGCFYGIGELNIRYFPVDEAHPTDTTDPYSFSKETVENIGAYYWRRDGISSVAMRFPGVYQGAFIWSDDFRRKRAAQRALLDELASLPEPEQRARVRDVQTRVLEFRRGRPFEYHPEQAQRPRRTFFDDPLFWTYAGDRYNFWSIIDVRDAAQSLEKGVTASYDGAHPLFINDHTNTMGYPSRTLVSLFFPEVSQFNGDFSGAAALVSIDRARSLIGFEPEYSVAALDHPENTPGAHDD
ncbi:MAG: NAD(P)-dependent oxidoreductase [Anaerolineae bacterium]|nr:NAD(P)-dependent oxidoreductase [Anaerolineae bacterium]